MDMLGVDLWVVQNTVPLLHVTAVHVFLQGGYLEHIFKYAAHEVMCSEINLRGYNAQLVLDMAKNTTRTHFNWGRAAKTDSHIKAWACVIC